MDASDGKQRIPKQNRSLETKNHIIERATALFSEKNFYEISVNEIITAIGVPVGSFYAYFKDKKQLYIQVIEHYDEQIRNGMTTPQNIDNTNIEEQLKQLIDSILQSHKKYNKLLIKINAMASLDDDVKTIARKWDNRSIEQVHYLLKLNKNQLQIKDTKTAAYLIYCIIEKTIHDLVNGDCQLKENRVINELTNMIIKYLYCVR